MKLTNQLQKIRDDLNGICQLCHSKSEETLHCDHDHKTERVRGFVCSWCNKSVISTGERKPELVSLEVRAYLTNPPLAPYNLYYKNHRVKRGISRDGCHFGDRSMTQKGFHKILYRRGAEIARAFITEISFAYDDYQAVATVKYRSGDTIEAKYTDEDELMDFILLNEKRKY